jgi:hypothetical protein
MGLPLAPWHMWGDVAHLTVPNQGDFTTGQLCRINYRRPETWSFLFGVRLVEAPTVGAGTTPLVTVAFDVILGIGRANLQIVDRFAAVTGFANFNFSWAIAAAPPVGQLKWTTAVNAPAMRDTDVTPVTPLVDHFPAEDINITCRAGFAGGAGPLSVKLELHAFVAPRSHTRPDWYRNLPDKARFLGNEYGGT